MSATRRGGDERAAPMGGAGRKGLDTEKTEEGKDKMHVL